MGGITRRESTSRVSTPSSSPRSSGHVAFAETLVTGVSRKAENDELQIAWNFEAHAAHCGDFCRKPHAVAAAGGALCYEGRILAVEVAKLGFRIRGKDEVYFKSHSTGQETRIELPNGYNNVISLLRALRDHGHNIVRSPSPIYEYAYSTSPPTTHQTSRRSSALYVDAPTQIPYDTYTVEPKSSSRHHHHKSRRHSKSHSHDDEGHKSRSKRYSYTIAEPSRHSYHR